jgi:hypothetical protein
METRKVYFQDLPKIMELEFGIKNPFLLEKTRNKLRQFSHIIQLIVNHLNLLYNISKEKSKSHEIISHCLDVLSSVAGKTISYLDREAIGNLLEFKKQIGPLKVILHSLQHIETTSVADTSSSLKIIDKSFNLLNIVMDRIKDDLNKNRQIYSNLQEKFKTINLTIKKLAKEYSNAENILSIDNYSIHFNALFNKYLQSPNTNSNVDYNFGLFLSKEKTLITHKIEIILEYPRFLAFQYSTDLNNIYENSVDGNSVPFNFRSIISNMNNTGFVENHLFRYPIEDFVQTIRLLHKYEKENEDENSESLVSIYYDEKVFLDLCSEFNVINRLIKLSDFESTQITLKNYRFASGQEYKHLKEIGEKLYEFSSRILKFNQFNKSFDEFREEIQTFFFKEFKIIVDIYY